MKVSSLKISAVVAMALSATTSAYAAMPVASPAADNSSIVLVDCAFGWYRGPDGQCYISGTGPRYRGNGVYYEHRDWRGGDGDDDDYQPPYRRYRYYRRPYVIEGEDY